MGEQYSDSYEEALMQGDKVLGGLGDKRHDFPIILYTFRPSPAFAAVQPLFDQQNELWEHYERLEEAFTDDPDSAELEQQIEALEDQLDEIENEIEVMGLTIRSDRTGEITVISYIRIQHGTAEIQPQLG